MRSIKEKSVSGVAWAIIEKFGTNGAKVILGIILARLLTPEDFGLIGMITVFFVLAQVFVDSGFAMAYVQKKQIKDADSDTVFFTNLFISLILYIVLFSCAPLIAEFYNQPQLVDLTRVMALVIIINAIIVIQRAQIIRNISFKKLTKITLISSLLSGALGIISAYKGMGVWALVVQSISSRAFNVIGFWYKSDYMPRWRFSKRSFLEMFSFGFWVLFSSFITTFFNNIYILAIGKFFPVAQLGYYTKAQQLGTMSSNSIAQAVGSVAFPVYSSLQDDREKLMRTMKKFIQNTMFFIVPTLAILIVVAKPLIVILLTEKWAPMIPYFQLICVASLLYPLNQINTQLIIALGKSKLSFNITLVRNLARLINIYFTYKVGVEFMILGEVFISIIFFFINTRYSNRYSNYGIFDQIKDIWKILLGGIVSAFVALGFIILIDSLIIWLIAGVIITGLTFLIIEYLINKELVIVFISLVRNLIQNK